jgi:hypothetical protein
MEECRGVDARCSDEIDELKKIFYRFFVPQENLLAADKPKQKDSTKNFNPFQNLNSKAPKQYQKEMDGIKITLKELYDEKAEREKKQEERERKLA